MYMNAVLCELKQAEPALQESLVSQHLFCTKELMCPLDFDHYLIRIFCLFYFFPRGHMPPFLGQIKQHWQDCFAAVFKQLKDKWSPVKHSSAEDLRAVPAPQWHCCFRDSARRENWCELELVLMCFPPREAYCCSEVSQKVKDGILGCLIFWGM